MGEFPSPGRKGRSLRNAMAGARLIQPEGLDSKSAADLAASLQDALEELHRLQYSLDRRIRRDQELRSSAPMAGFTAMAIQRGVGKSEQPLGPLSWVRHGQ
jgi:hypothetical protein